MTSHKLILNALNCENSGRAPVWLMRQAGRHLASYRRLRQKYSFMQMCKQPELIAEVTKLPLAEYNIDAAILFSDILTIPDAMGLGLEFKENIGPVFQRPIKCFADIEAISSPDMQALSYVFDGIKLLSQDLNKPLLGFCGAPFTVASYMLEGGSSKNFTTTKKWLYRHPEQLEKLLQKITDWSIEYLKMQIQAGALAVQIFDSWAGCLSIADFQNFALKYIEKILAEVRQLAPVIVFTKGSASFAPLIAKTSANCISLDWSCELVEMRKLVGNKVALQGNLDPDMLYAPPAKIVKEVTRILAAMQSDQGFIFNLGHGIHPDVPQESVKALVDTVVNFERS